MNQEILLDLEKDILYHIYNIIKSIKNDQQK